MRRIAFGLLAAFALVSSGSVGSHAERPSEAFGDARFDARFTIPGVRPITPMQLIAGVHGTAKVSLVAAGTRLGRPVETKTRDYSVREAMRLLEGHLEGKWRPVGQTGAVFTLGPPAGFEKIGALTPVGLRDHMDRQWQQVFRALTRPERAALASGRALQGSELSSAVLKPAREIARAIYWRQRRGKDAVIRLTTLAQDAFEIEPQPDGSLLLAVQRIRGVAGCFTDRYPETYVEATVVAP
jgi:hypothetical protein